ncbi:sugar porter family MFS transporter [Chelatococcus sp. GCM10030263]|uniref:sugar porter family MFS transporter n=1 Tax=Chelatococcus sp. GCM10030263 TaxID=3273387 RepID=UPI003613F762
MTDAVQKHRTRSIVVMCIVAATGGFLYGFDIAVIAGALPQISAMWRLSSIEEGMLASAILGGGMVGSLIGGGLADRFGRRSIMMGTAALFVIGAFWCGLASSLWPLTAGRALLGVAVGIVLVAVPLYIAEIAPPNIRGALVSMQQLFLSGGVLVAYLVNTLFAADAEGWRPMFMAGALPGVLLGVGMLFMPESPRWYLSRGRLGSAKRMLRRLGYADAEGQEEIAALQGTLGEDNSTATWKELSEPWLRPAMFIGVALIFYQQMSGIGFVTFYTPTIFALAGYEMKSSAMLLTVGVGALNLVMTAVAMALVDRIGRRPMFIGGLVGIVVTLTATGLSIFYVADIPAMRWLVVTAVFLYIIVFSLSLGSVTGAVTSEIFPQRVRGLALSVVVVAAWLFEIAVSATFPPFVEMFGASATFIAYALVGVSGLVFGLFYLPETRGRTLEEIEAFWRSGQSPSRLR